MKCFTSLAVIRFSIVFSFVSLFISCDVVHTYDAEIKVVDAQLNPVSGATVSTSVSVDAPHIVYRTGTTSMDGTVNFSFINEAVLKVEAVKGEFTGQALLVIEEDNKALLTLEIY
jgi:hypothetical protein